MNNHINKTLLTINNLTISIAHRPLITNFNLTADHHDIIAITGNNGSGKTSLLQTLSGVIPYDKGQILFHDQDLSKYSPIIRAQKITLLQQHSLNSDCYTAIARIAHGLMPLYGFNTYIDDHIIITIKNMAQKLDITHLLHKQLNHLSGGELRLINIAKCLINPYLDILLLDEPSVFLDQKQKNILINILKKEASLGKLIIFSSHETDFINKLASKIIKI